MEFIKKNLSNILFIGFVIFLFTPLGLPVRATLIKAVSYVTTRVLSMEIDKKDQVLIANPDWQLSALQGPDINFKELKGEVIVVNFWATWCPPCVAEMPSFQTLYEAYGDQVVFLFVANDDPIKVDKFIKSKEYDFPVYFQASRVPDDMNSTSLPTTYIIDKSGHIVASKVGAADWNSAKVKNLLKDLLE